MRVLLLGSGGRESALAWALARSRRVSELIAAPGNPGIASFAAVEPVDVTSAPEVVSLARRVSADLVVIGPEAPLSAGVSDELRAEGRLVFGPDAAAARIEASKAHAKQVMERAGVPTAAWRSFESVDGAIAYLDELGPPYVVKADGLAGGKGVVVTSDRGEAIEAVRERLVEGAFGAAGTRVVIEEFLDGEEVSLIAFTDGRAVVACEPAQDYKRALDDDRGPNTGGMGSYSPVPACPSTLVDEITGSVLEPVVAALAEGGTPFVGALYAGLALTTEGPKVVEFNARFGDPETQALLPRLSSDVGEVCLATSVGELAGLKLEWSPEACVCVVVASRGYPGSHEVGMTVTGIEEAASKGAHLFHAATAVRDGRLVTAGGRVLSVSALGPTFAEARRRAYEAVAAIDFEGKHFRCDIAARAEQAERVP